MANENTIILGPPPLGTPLLAEGMDRFGIPYELRDVPLAGDAAVVWADHWHRMFQARVALGFPFEIESAAGAIGIKFGTAIITAGAAAAMTLVAPVAGPPAGPGPGAATAGAGDDGKILSVLSTTAFAHTVTVPANKFNGNKAVATFGAAAGNVLVLFAYQGIWYVLPSNGITLT